MSMSRCPVRRRCQLAIDRETGLVEYETTRGAISYLNDLHKGRNTGLGWAIFLDVFSLATIFFCLTGLWLLQIHSGKRAITWPLTGQPDHSPHRHHFFMH